MNEPGKRIRRQTTQYVSEDFKAKTNRRSSLSLKPRSSSQTDNSSHRNRNAEKKAEKVEAEVIDLKERRRRSIDEKYPDKRFTTIRKINSKTKFSKEQRDEEKARVVETVEEVLKEVDVIIQKEFAALFEDSENDKPASCSEKVVLLNSVKNDVSGSGSEEEEEPAPIKMDYFEPITENVEGFDELQLPNIPVICENMDLDRVCGRLYNIYPNGIHGYNKNEYRVSDQLLFMYMERLLPKTVHPDLFYYTLYRLFPNYGTQEEMSEVFPKLVRQFVEEETEQKRLFKYETWKQTGSEIQPMKPKPLDYKNPCSQGNYFVKSCSLPDQDFTKKCSENCYRMISERSVKEIKKRFNNPTHAKFYIKKSISKECAFLNSFFLDTENDVVNDFCDITRRHEKKSCDKWFEFLTSLTEFPGPEELTDDYYKLSWNERNKSFVKKYSANQKLRNGRASREGMNEASTSPFTPCCHVGPCGPGISNCTCQVFCSVFCQCDDNCAQKFPGCNCQKGKCRTESCPCQKFKWECMPDTCKSCLHSENNIPPECLNYALTRGDFKPIVVKKSFIAGNGAFIGEDAEKDDLIGEYVGEIISKEETERRGTFYENQISYIYEFFDVAVDAGRAGNALRFLNHADEPNCRPDAKIVRGKPRLGIRSNQIIRSGTELTLHYGYQPDDADMFFNVAPEDRVPKALSPKAKPAKITSKQERQQKCDTDCVIVPTVTRYGRRSGRLSEVQLVAKPEAVSSSSPTPSSSN